MHGHGFKHCRQYWLNLALDWGQIGSHVVAYSPGVGVTKPISSFPLFSVFCRIIKTKVIKRLAWSYMVSLCNDFIWTYFRHRVTTILRSYIHTLGEIIWCHDLKPSAFNDDVNTWKRCPYHWPSQRRTFGHWWIHRIMGQWHASLVCFYFLFC